MRRMPFIVSGLALGVLMTLSASPLLAAFLPVPGSKVVPSTASVTLEGWVWQSCLASFTIQATPLPASAFFGKNVVIPVQLIGAGPLDPTQVNVSIIYQLFNGSIALTPISTPIPITFIADPANPTILNGSAIIPESDLQAIQDGGQLYYVFRTANVIQGVGAPSWGSLQLYQSFFDLVIPNDHHRSDLCECQSLRVRRQCAGPFHQ